MIENEDLRDQISLVAQKGGASIDYLPYLVPKQFEKAVERVQDSFELDKVKNMILTHVYSLRKDNR